MGSKKKTQVWKKALIHFSLCFVMGFFTGFMPAGKPSGAIGIPPEPSPSPPPHAAAVPETAAAARKETPAAAEESSRKELQEEFEMDTAPRRLLIVVTAASARDKRRVALVRRMASTLSLVPAPVLWVVAEAAVTEAPGEEPLPEILRRTRVMYRHVVVRENFTDAAAEMERLRTVALAHIEHHRISGIVHFAGLYNVYDLDFFQSIREIEVFGTWPVAYLSPNRKRVAIEGPVCDSAQVIGWHQRHAANQTKDDSNLFPIQLSNFAFNSSVLWDPERWGRTSSAQDTTQNSIGFVKQEVLEEEAKLRGIPEDCSKVMLWHLYFPIATTSNH